MSKPTLAVIYARVSSKDQESGYSIDAQVDGNRSYAQAEGMEIVAEFVETGSGRKAGRDAFGRMVEFLAAGRAEVILVDKADRLHRNITDEAKVYELGVEIHYTRSRMKVDPQGGRPAEKFIARVLGAQAEFYSDNLREEVLKGMNKAVEYGRYPSNAPLGYLNARHPEGHGILIPDPERAEVIREMFALYVTGEWSLRDLTTWAQGKGLTSRTGKIVAFGTLSGILQNPFYYGEFRWRGELRQHGFEPLVSELFWAKCQEIRSKHRRRRGGKDRKEFAYTRLMVCGECGAGMVGEEKRQRHGHRYVYYRCSRGKRGCSQGYVREEAVEKAVVQELRQLRISEQLVEAIRSHASAIHRAKGDVVLRERRRMQQAEERLLLRIERAGASHFDGELPLEDYRSLVAAWKLELQTVRGNLSEIEEAGEDGTEALVDVLDLARGAAIILPDLKPRVRRLLVGFFLEDLRWANGDLHSAWRDPWGPWALRTREDRLLERFGEDLDTRARILLEDRTSNPEDTRNKAALRSIADPESRQVEATVRPSNLSSLLDRLSGLMVQGELLAALRVLRAA